MYPRHRKRVISSFMILGFRIDGRKKTTYYYQVFGIFYATKTSENSRGTTLYTYFASLSEVVHDLLTYLRDTRQRARDVRGSSFDDSPPGPITSDWTTSDRMVSASVLLPDPLPHADTYGETEDRCKRTLRGVGGGIAEATAVGVQSRR